MEGARVCKCGLQFLNRMVLEGFLEEVMFGQRHGRDEGFNHVCIWAENVLDQGSS